MPRTSTITKTVYQFNELNDEAKEKARDWYRQGALDYDWWDHIYQDAKNLDLKITQFDIDHRTIKGNFTGDIERACNFILGEYGRKDSLYKLAKTYSETIKDLKWKYLDNTKENDKVSQDENEEAYQDAIEDLTHDFKNELLEEFLLILCHEYEWLMADKQVDESILANEYEFDAEGNRT